jgi:hypothetical protein
MSMIGIVNPKFKIASQISEVVKIGSMGCLFLWGISGFLIIARNQFIDNIGPNIRKYKGFWAILNGIVLVVVGWGGVIFYALSSIFNS